MTPPFIPDNRQKSKGVKKGDLKTMKNNQTNEIMKRKYEARYEAIKRLQSRRQIRYYTPAEQKFINDIRAYNKVLEATKKSKDSKHNDHREKLIRKSETRRDIILFYSPIIIRILMVIIGFSITMEVTDWADKVLFNYDILYTLAFCGICGWMFVMLCVVFGEWVIERIRINNGYYKFY